MLKEGIFDRLAIHKHIDEMEPVTSYQGTFYQGGESSSEKKVYIAICNGSGNRYIYRESVW